VIHVLAILGYAAAALAISRLLGDRLALESWRISDIALAGLVVVASAHVGLMQAAFRRRTERALSLMHAAQQELRREAGAARDTAQALQETLVRAAQEREGDNSRLGAVTAELQVLQTLVEELSRQNRPAPVPALATAPAPLRAPEPPVLDESAGRPIDRRLLRGIGESEVLSIVRQGLREGRVDLYVQPIVSLPQRKHRFYECFSRIRSADGAIVGPDQYLLGAEREGLIGAIDNMLLFRCVQLVRRIHKARREVAVFVNISEHSLADKRFFRDFAAFVSDNAELAPYLIFEFAQSHVARHGAAVMLELERLSRRGFRFSMDQIVDFDLDVDLLAQRQFRFIKMDAQRLLHAARAGEPRFDLHRFKEALERNQIDLIVERIEDEQLLVELLDYPIDFGQGYLFGEPRLAKAA
jgi:cyclic-di-GMP phosphodiesterase TipF (flagellum assembly factor)